MYEQIRRSTLSGTAFTILNYICFLIHKIDYLRQEHTPSHTKLELLYDAHSYSSLDLLRIFIILILNIFYMFNVENRFRSNGVYRVQCVIVALSCFLVFRYTGSFLYVPLIETGVIILAIVSFTIASKRSQGSLTVFSVNIIPIYINCFSGLYLTDSRLSISNVASAFVGVLLVSLWILNRNTKGVYQRLTVICIIAIMFTVLLLAYREYQHMRTEVSYAPVGQPWRSLYFTSILTWYLIIPHLWNIQSSYFVLSRDIIRAFFLSVVAICVVPVLFCFTPHGVVLLMGSGMWIVFSHVHSGRVYRNISNGVSLSSLQIPAMTVVLLSILILDRIAYFPLLQVLAPTFALVQVFGIVIAASGVLAAVSSKISTTTLFSFIKWLRKDADRVFKVNLLVCIFSALCILFFVAMHSMFEYSINVAKTGSLNIAAVPINGFSGLNSWSWVCGCYFMYLLVIIVTEAIHIFKVTTHFRN